LLDHGIAKDVPDDHDLKPSITEPPPPRDATMVPT
jgi:hypothetical protein